MENLGKSIKVEAIYDWIKIIDYRIIKDKYGYKGWIEWNTERNPRHQKISSIHLDQNEGFKRYFRWKI